MNIWYEKLQEDLKQSKHNLKKDGLYVGRIRHQVEALLYTLKLEEEDADDLKKDLNE